MFLSVAPIIVVILGGKTMPMAKAQNTKAQNTKAQNTNANSASLNAHLSALETKLFLHDYSSDLTDVRLGRLEQMVFGHQTSGMPAQRLQKLTVAISKDDLSAASSNVNTNNAEVARGGAADIAAVGVMPAPAPSFGRSPVGPYGPPALRNSLPSGTVVSSLPPLAPPIADWTRPSFVTPPYSASTYSSSVPGYSGSMVSRVDWLENKLFGRTFDDNLPVRILRLEGKVFPNSPPATNLSLNERLNRLINAVSLNTHG